MHIRLLGFVNIILNIYHSLQRSNPTPDQLIENIKKLRKEISCNNPNRSKHYEKNLLNSNFCSFIRLREVLAIGERKMKNEDFERNDQNEIIWEHSKWFKDAFPNVYVRNDIYNLNLIELNRKDNYGNIQI